MTYKPKFILFISAVLALFGAGGCNLYPDSETRVEDLDMVFTRYDNQTDFKSVGTYSLVDAVYKIDGDTTNALEAVTNSAYILSVIESNMEALGYEKWDDSQNPDLRIAVTASSSTTIFYYYNYYDYYYPYWGWGGYYGGWYYPYYGYPTVESYTTGTLFMDMVDFKNVSSGDSLKVVWNGVVNGLLNEDTQANLKTRIKNSIDEAFRQSPYLDINPN